MFGIPWKFIGIALAALSVIAGAYFAVQHYNSVTAENARLNIEIASVRAEKEQIQQDYQNIVTTVDSNAMVERTVNNHTETVIREIQSAPVTTECIQSPAISIAIESLKDEN